MDKFWSEHIEAYQNDTSNSYVITGSGECYIMNSVNRGIHGFSTSAIKGHGGHWFSWQDQRYNGELRVCNDMWYIGTAPEEVLVIMKPNALFTKECLRKRILITSLLANQA